MVAGFLVFFEHRKNSVHPTAIEFTGSVKKFSFRRRVVFATRASSFAGNGTNERRGTSANRLGSSTDSSRISAKCSASEIFRDRTPEQGRNASSTREPCESLGTDNPVARRGQFRRFGAREYNGCGAWGTRMPRTKKLPASAGAPRTRKIKVLAATGMWTSTIIPNAIASRVRRSLAEPNASPSS